MALKEVLTRLRLDQVAVADGIEVSRGTVGNWVHRRTNPQGANLVRLWEFLKRYDESLRLEDLLSPELAAEPAASEASK